MKKHLFIFGYESPPEWEWNRKHATDMESSNAVWILASTQEQALVAGERFAQDWVGNLFRSAGVSSYEGWAAGNFAHWIEEDPLERFSGHELETLKEITAEPNR